MGRKRLLSVIQNFVVVIQKAFIVFEILFTCVVVHCYDIKV